MNDKTKEWLLKVATFVEHFPAMPKESARQLFIDTPTQAAVHAVNAVPVEEREAVAEAITRVSLSNDFGEAALQIRQAAEH